MLEPHEQDPHAGSVDVRRMRIRRTSTIVALVGIGGAVALGIAALDEATAAQPVLWVEPSAVTAEPSLPDRPITDDAATVTASETTRSTGPEATSAPVETGAADSTTPAPQATVTAPATPTPTPTPTTAPTTSSIAPDVADTPADAGTEEAPPPTSVADVADTSAPTTAPPTTVAPDAPLVRPVSVSSTGVHISDRPVIPVGTEPDGALEVPGADEIGWYERGGSPGRPGATVLAAHVTWNGDLGPFYELGKSRVGDRLDVVLEDGSTRQYEVVEVTMYDKYELPGDRIWRDEGPETLVLITCGGRFDDSINRFRDNIVVYAEPVV